jgi:hypothetical protein
MRKNCVALVCFALLAAGAACAASPAGKPDPSEEKDGPVHDEIRAMRDGILAAIKKKDADALIAYLHPNVVLTLQDDKELKTIRKHDGARDYLKRTLTGPNPGLKSFEPTVTVDELTILYDDDKMGIAFGSSSDHYVMADGNEFTVPTRWSATLVKHEGKWKVANLQVSSNPFDNAVVSAITKRAYWYVGGAAAIGLLVGVIVMLVLRKPAKPAAQANP